MPPSNTSKYRLYADGDPLYGPDDGNPGHQNLGIVQQLLASELDAIFAVVFGPGVVVSQPDMQVSAGVGLTVTINTGVAFGAGRRIALGGSSAFLALPASTSGIKVYVEPGPTWSATLVAWPASFGATIGSLPDGAVHLATVATDGAVVTQVVDERAVVAGSLSDFLSAAVVAALAGTSGTPGDTNRFVTNADARLLTTDQKAALAGTAGTPGAANPYVTTQDTRLLPSSSIPAHAITHAVGGSDPLTPAAIGIKHYATTLSFARLMALSLM